MPSDPAVPAGLDATLNRYFIEHRAKLLDIAAFLDRCDRATGGTPDAPVDEDFRLEALRRAVALLDDGQPERTRRILERLSDLSTTPLDASPGGGAVGAPRPEAAAS